MEKLRFIAKYLKLFEKFALTKTQVERLHAPGSQFGIISARRSERGSGENKKKHTELVQYIQDLNLKWESTKGVWPEAEEKGYGLENSIIAYEIPFEFIIDLGRFFDQESIIFKPEDGPVGLYDLNKNTAVLWTEFDVQTGVKRPRKMVEEGEIAPSTRFRDIQVVYDFDFSNPVVFTDDSPVYAADKPEPLEIDDWDVEPLMDEGIRPWETPEPNQRPETLPLSL